MGEALEEEDNEKQKEKKSFSRRLSIAFISKPSEFVGLSSIHDREGLAERRRRRWRAARKMKQRRDNAQDSDLAMLEDSLPSVLGNKPLSER